MKPAKKKQTPKQARYVIIMAGGRGERFWPVSRQKTPKQLITLLGRKSFLQEAFDRVTPLVPPDHVIVITNAVQAAAVRKQLPRLPPANVVAEPCGRDTCAAVTLGAALVGARHPNGVMAVLPADHVIPEADRFREVLAAAFEVAANAPEMVTIGIKPTEPATGYGYIRTGRPLASAGQGRAGGARFFRARSFVEKPDRPTAERYLRSGEYRWNAGMFIWSFPTILTGLETHCPSMGSACRRWLEAERAGRLRRVLAREYPRIEKISIDFALMEQARNVVVADGDFAWDDLGAWTALKRHLPSDPDGNHAVGDLVALDAQGNILFDERRDGRHLIALVGVSDLVVVQTDDVTLIAHQHEAQKIKQLVARLGGDPKHEKLV